MISSEEVVPDPGTFLSVLHRFGFGGLTFHQTKCSVLALVGHSARSLTCNMAGSGSRIAIAASLQSGINLLEGRNKYHSLAHVSPARLPVGDSLVLVSTTTRNIYNQSTSLGTTASVHRLSQLGSDSSFTALSSGIIARDCSSTGTPASTMRIRQI